MKRALMACSALALVGAGVYGGLSGCAAEAVPTVVPRPDGATAAPPDANLEAALEAEAHEEPTPPRPAFVPEGWNLWTDFRKAAQIYLPSSKAVLPPPAKWEPCRADFYPTSDAGPAPCEEWAIVEPGQTKVGTNNVLVGMTSQGLSGLVVPQLRFFKDYATWMAIRIDTGKVLNGVINGSPSWFAYPSAPSATATLYTIREAQPGPVAQVGYLIAPHNRAEKVYGGRNESVSSAMIGETLATSVGHGFLAEGPFSEFGRTVSFRETDGLQPLPGFYRKDTAYIYSAVSYRSVWRVLRPGGVETWFDNLPDLSAEVIGVATDDTDVVWHQGERCKAGNPCEVASLYTSAYPSAGAKPAGRRLRSEYPSVSRLVVGCGHVAATGGFAPSRTMIRVTRLRDGVSFLRQKPVGSEFSYQQPIAVTCEHVYFTRVDQIDRNAAPLTTLVRIRLDALGAEIPPD